MTNNFVVSSGTGTAAIGTSLAVPSDYSFVDFTGTLNLKHPTTLVDAGSDPSGRTSFDGIVSGNVGTLTIAGSRVTLSAANTFTGNVDITGGALLQLNGGGTNQVLPLTANVQLTQGTLSLVGDAAIGSFSGAASSTVEVSPLVSIAATLTTGANNASTTFAGQLLDGGDILSLTKVGTGTLTLSGANTYSGRTTVAQGTAARPRDEQRAAHGRNADAGRRHLRPRRPQPDARVAHAQRHLRDRFWQRGHGQRPRV